MSQEWDNGDDDLGSYADDADNVNTLLVSQLLSPRKIPGPALEPAMEGQKLEVVTYFKHIPRYKRIKIYYISSSLHKT